MAHSYSIRLENGTPIPRMSEIKSITPLSTSIFYPMNDKRDPDIASPHPKLPDIPSRRSSSSSSRSAPRLIQSHR